MDAERFDTLTRFISSRTSRRVTVGLVATGLLAITVPEAETKAVRCSETTPCPGCYRCKKHKCKKNNGASCTGGTCQKGSCRCTGAGFSCTDVALCCQQEQACLAESCGACPESPDPCTSGPECGRTTADNPQCFCVTSVEGTTTCSSIFATLDQVAECTTDDDCTDVLGPGVEAVCVNAPCLGLGFEKVCLNTGCVDLNSLASTSRVGASEPRLRQPKLRSPHS
jgi:hypothetical protein